MMAVSGRVVSEGYSQHVETTALVLCTLLSWLAPGEGCGGKGVGFEECDL